MPALVDIALPAVLGVVAAIAATPRQIRALRDLGVPRIPPSAMATTQAVLFTLAGAAAGAALTGLTGLRLTAWPVSLGPPIAVTLVGLIGHLALYYLWFRPRIPRDAIQLGEALRARIGLLAKLLQGGIVEEVQYRWGLMSALAAGLAWLGLSREGEATAVAVLLSALVFAGVHLLGARQIGLAKSRAETALILVDNSLAGLVFGWLFWRYGLVAAAGAHGLFHAVWHPIEAGRDPTRESTGIPSRVSPTSRTTARSISPPG